MAVCSRFWLAAEELLVGFVSKGRFMKRNLLFLTLGALVAVTLLSIGAQAGVGRVYIDSVQGGYGGDTVVLAGQTFRLVIGMDNATTTGNGLGRKVHVSNGFMITSFDDALWDSVRIEGLSGGSSILNETPRTFCAVDTLVSGIDTTWDTLACFTDTLRSVTYDWDYDFRNIFGSLNFAFTPGRLTEPYRWNDSTFPINIVRRYDTTWNVDSTVVVRIDTTIARWVDTVVVRQTRAFGCVASGAPNQGLLTTWNRATYAITVYCSEKRKPNGWFPSDGKHICIDSSYFYPSVFDTTADRKLPWRWTASNDEAVYTVPKWEGFGAQVHKKDSGGYCFLVYDPNRPTAVDDRNGGNVPKGYALEQNYPNPFNPSTIINFYVPTRSWVNLTVYNVLGQKVKTLIDGDMGVGNHSRRWDGVTDAGTRVASGIYFYRMEAGSFIQTKKMMMLK